MQPLGAAYFFSPYIGCKGVIYVAKKNSADLGGAYVQPSAVIQGLFVALLLLVIAALLLATIVYFSSWQGSLKLLSTLAHACVLIGSLWAGRSSERKAWLHGSIVGVLSFFVLGWIGHNPILLLSWFWWQRLLRIGLISMLGGIVGGLVKR